jgi:hypothetical protein
MFLLIELGISEIVQTPTGFENVECRNEQDITNQKSTFNMYFLLHPLIIIEID